MKNYLILFIIVTFLSCIRNKSDIDKTRIAELKKEDFQKEIDGKQTGLYMIENSNGIKVYLTNYGARVVSLITADKEGKMADIVLGFDNIKSYLEDQMYLGCIVGRYANRINKAKFTIGDKEYQLNKNEGENTLHGGIKGLDKIVWNASQEGNSMTFTYLSPNGEEGYPGNLQLSKKYTLTNDNELKIEYEAETDKATIVNLSNHSYFNLKGEGDTTVLDHFFLINADYYTPVDSKLIPTGEIVTVEHTPFDFREGKKIGTDINKENEQLKNGGGYDHNWVLNKDSVNTLTFVSKLWEESTGRYLEIYTTAPGVQFYSGNFMNGTIKGKCGKPYEYRSAVAIETQHFPDSPNHENFPSTLLMPGEKYLHTVIFKFGTIK